MVKIQITIGTPTIPKSELAISGRDLERIAAACASDPAVALYLAKHPNTLPSTRRRLEKSDRFVASVAELARNGNGKPAKEDNGKGFNTQDEAAAFYSRRKFLGLISNPEYVERLLKAALNGKTSEPALVKLNTICTLGSEGRDRQRTLNIIRAMRAISSNHEVVRLLGKEAFEGLVETAFSDVKVLTNLFIDPRNVERFIKEADTDKVASMYVKIGPLINAQGTEFEDMRGFEIMASLNITLANFAAVIGRMQYQTRVDPVLKALLRDHERTMRAEGMVRDTKNNDANEEQAEIGAVDDGITSHDVRNGIGREVLARSGLSKEQRKAAQRLFITQIHEKLRADGNGNGNGTGKKEKDSLKTAIINALAMHPKRYMPLQSITKVVKGFGINVTEVEVIVSIMGIMAESAVTVIKRRELAGFQDVDGYALNSRFAALYVKRAGQAEAPAQIQA